jgi:hypothetical protein
MPMPGPVVLGRPRVSFFEVSGIDFAIYSRYHKIEPEGRAQSSAPALTRTMKG